MAFSNSTLTVLSRRASKTAFTHPFEQRQKVPLSSTMPRLTRGQPQVMQTAVIVSPSLVHLPHHAISSLALAMISSMPVVSSAIFLASQSA
jgi:hypothetical protein